MELVAIGVWLLLCVLVGVFAGNRGRIGFGWGMISVIFSPLIGWLIVLALPNLQKEQSRDGLGNVITEVTHKRCPACREVIRRDAVKCRHCGEILSA